MERTKALVEQATALYTFAALQLNSSELARKSYDRRTDNPELFTAATIPRNLRVQPLTRDISISYKRDEPIEVYGEPMVKHIAQSYIVELIGVFDGYFEDLNVLLLRSCRPKLKEADIALEIGAGYRRKQFDITIENALNIRKPRDRFSTYDMVLNRYGELRVLRNALVHTRGELSNRHVQQLERLKMDTRGIPGAVGLSDMSMLDGRRVQLSYGGILFVRKWSLECAFYFLDLLGEQGGLKNRETIY